MDSPSIFPTFCHISEYDEDGYFSLRQMISASAPITLWAPSSYYFTTEKADISAAEFLELVRDGAVRIIGRRGWFYDQAWRTKKSADWKGYQWNSYFDGLIRDILEYDEQRLSRSHGSADGRAVARVMAVGDAPGPGRVDGAMAQLTGQDCKDLYDAYKTALRPNPRMRLPRGVVQAAQRGEDTQEAVVRSILIDAINHAAAHRDSAALSPFLLDSPDSLFLKRIAVALEGDAQQAVENDASRAADPASRPSGHSTEVERLQEITHKLSRQLLEILKKLEDKGLRRPGSLSRFVHSEGHQALTEWYAAQHAEYQRSGDPHRLDNELLIKLSGEFAGQSRSDFVRRLAADPWTTSFAGISGILTILSYVSNRSDPLSIGGLAVTGLSSGLAGLRTLGWVPGARSLEHWAYLYAYGKPVTKRKKSEVKRWLEDLISDGT